MVTVREMAEINLEQYDRIVTKWKLPERLGPYEPQTLLALGGMAEIYLACQKGIKGFKRLVVIKRILPHLASQRRFIEMFLDEGRIAALLNHPNIVQIYDLGQDDDNYYIAMEYLEGESLGCLVHQARKSHRRLNPELAARIVLEVCTGLEYAHELTDAQGKSFHIVHRDVSPHNIIVLFSGKVKLVDFGIAKAKSQTHHTISGTLKGKPTYMSPEQLRNKPVDARTDIFSIGVVFWELLAGKRLFKRDSDAASIQAIMNERIPRVHEVRENTPAQLDNIAHRALQKDPGKRYQSIREMSSDIKEYLRQVLSSVDVREVAAFVNEVLGERARMIRNLLKTIHHQGATDVSMGVLKPESEESLLSREDPPPCADGSKPDQNRGREGAESTLDEIPTRCEKAPWLVPRPHWLALLCIVTLLAAGVVLLVWLGDEPTTKSPTSTPVPVASKPRNISDPAVFENTHEGMQSVPVEAKKHPEPTARITKPKPGVLNLNTNPWSEIYLGRRRLGMTPVMGVKLRAGKHTFTAVNRGMRIRQKISLTIRSGKATDLFVKLKR
jgi:serine/threonine-protein kinase